MDPAVGVHDSGGNIVDDAVDWVADEGLGPDSIRINFCLSFDPRTGLSCQIEYLELLYCHYKNMLPSFGPRLAREFAQYFKILLNRAPGR